MTARRYYPNLVPQPTAAPRGEEESPVYRDMRNLLEWLRREHQQIYEDLSTGADVNTLREPPKDPYNGMLRYFIENTATGEGWSPDGLGTGLFFFHGGYWYRLYVAAGVLHDPLDTTVDLMPNAGGTAIGASDIRLKKNIEPASPDFLGIVSQWELVRFQWRGSSRRAMGMIADQVKEVAPEAVLDHNGYKHLDLLTMIAYLAGAVQQLNQKPACFWRRFFADFKRGLKT